MKRKENKKKKSAFSFPATHFLTVCMYVSMYCTEVKGDNASFDQRESPRHFVSNVGRAQ